MASSRSVQEPTGPFARKGPPGEDLVIVVTAHSRHDLTAMTIATAAAPLVMVPAPETVLWLPHQFGYGQ